MILFSTAGISSTTCLLAQTKPSLFFVWNQATFEGKAIIMILVVFSIFAWSVMATKGLQMRRAKNLNRLFEAEFKAQQHVMSIYDRRVQVDGCPLFTVYQAGCMELEARLRAASGNRSREQLSFKAMEHVKRALERSVAQESLKLESGLILLAITVSGSPFLGLLGTVWGVMSAFSYVAAEAANGGRPDLATMAPGVAAALATTVAGLLVAIPSMFGYNALVHNLRVFTVGLDNFAQELVSKMETEYLLEDGIDLEANDESL